MVEVVVNEQNNVCVMPLVIYPERVYIDDLIRVDTNTAVKRHLYTVLNFLIKHTITSILVFLNVKAFALIFFAFRCDLAVLNGFLISFAVLYHILPYITST